MTLFGNISDSALVVGIGRWQEAALAEVYRRHGAAVNNLATRLLGSAHLGEEVTQEVFLDLWKRPEQFDASRGSLRTLLMTKAHGRAVDIVRSEEARTNREYRSAQEHVQGRYDLDYYAWGFSIAEQVKKALETLPHDERLAIEKAYYEGMTYRQVAEELGTPEGTVKTRIRSGLRRLRSILGTQEVEAP